MIYAIDINRINTFVTGVAAMGGKFENVTTPAFINRGSAYYIGQYSNYVSQVNGVRSHL
jgi:hypothetical protein